MAVPISLQGGWCSASSMTPSFNLPGKRLARLALDTIGVVVMTRSCVVHRFDGSRKCAAIGIAPQFAIGGQHAALDRQRLRLDVTRANLPVVRQAPRSVCAIAAFGLCLIHRPGDQRRRDNFARGQTSPPAARRECVRRSSSIGSGAMLWPELRISKFFSRPMMRQFPAGVQFALIAGVEPAARQRLRSVSSGRFQ